MAVGGVVVAAGGGCGVCGDVGGVVVVSGVVVVGSVGVGGGVIGLVLVLL